MSLSVVLYLTGMACLFVAERLLDAWATWRVGVGVFGLVVLGASIALRVRALKAATDDGIRYAEHRATVLSAVGVASLLVYVLTTREFVGVFAFSDAFETRWVGVFSAIWPIVWLVATIPLVLVDRSIQSSPVMMPKRRVNQYLTHGIAAALGIALVFPVNYVASRHDANWNFSYFKTASPGTSTLGLVDSLEVPIDVYVFQPAASDVTDEILSYFNAIDSESLRVRVLDQASDPALAKDLRVRDNGYIALTRAEAPEAEEDSPAQAKSQVVRIGTEVRKARPELKKLDEHVGKALMRLARGEQIAYVTTGHGEASWGESARADRSLEGFKQIAEFSNVKLKKLGLGHGLAEDVPQDADLVIIAGPTEDFLEAEVEAIKRYLKQGGSLLLAIDPDPRSSGAMVGKRDNLEALFVELGVRFPEGILASTRQVVAMSNNRADRLNVTTDSFSTHPSTVVLAESPARLFAPMAGYLEKIPGTENDVAMTVRSPANSWADLNGNLEFDETLETRKARGVAAGVVGGKSPNRWRAIVTSSSTMLSDFAIIVQGNQQFISDGVNWLIRAESFSGEVESEEDVQIQHTREGQAGWFYATVVAVPVLILVVGAIRTRRRKEV